MSGRRIFMMCAKRNRITSSFEMGLISNYDETKEIIMKDEREK